MFREAWGELRIEGEEGVVYRLDEVLEVEGVAYAIFLPENLGLSHEGVVFRIAETDAGYTFEPVEDPEEWQKVVDAYNEAEYRAAHGEEDSEDEDEA
ncbi:DUF1292 domain-containing protein [Brockia lithotrophica]|uniref:Uncharacterized protein DUF1292 n=1 Tax=Brockia lithotrophica TaxID=933949 RepID=A0A660KZB8_9BACL|nr:DUF1292 domain-containing protein [Brockia lithotrophica]RKQ83853.1 uncharacterized protein DUF1292 [Brockia lithotrophica]